LVLHNNEVWPYPFSTPCTTSGSELIRIVVVLHCCSYAIALPYSREHTWIGAKRDTEGRPPDVYVEGMHRGACVQYSLCVACCNGRPPRVHRETGRQSYARQLLQLQGSAVRTDVDVSLPVPAVRGAGLFYLRGLSASHLWAQPWSMVLKNVKRPHDDQGMWPQSYMVSSCLFCFFAIVVTELLSTHLAAQTLRSSDLKDYPVPTRANDF
jgi:hypothetical protein